MISLDGKRIAFGALVPGPPVRRPVLVASLADGASRQIFEDCGGRPRLWLDEDLLLAETFGSGLNSFVVLDTRTATQRPLLSSRDRRLSNPRLSTDGQWLVFDATPPGGSPSVLVARLDGGHAADESAWILMICRQPSVLVARRTSALLPADNADNWYPKQGGGSNVRSAHGRVGAEPIDVLTLSETIVPAMVSAAGPIVAGDQIVFVLGNYRGDIWMMNLEA